MPHGFPCNGKSAFVGGADPLVRGRRPRRPVRTLQDADALFPAAGRGRLARTRGSAPPLTSISVSSSYHLIVVTRSYITESLAVRIWPSISTPTSYWPSANGNCAGVTFPAGLPFT